LIDANVKRAVFSEIGRRKRLARRTSGSVS